MAHAKLMRLERHDHPSSPDGEWIVEIVPESFNIAHRRYIRRIGPHSERCSQTIERFLRTGSRDFYRAVLAISDPPAEVESPRNNADKPAKANALHSPRYRDVNRRHVALPTHAENHPSGSSATGSGTNASHPDPAAGLICSASAWMRRVLVRPRKRLATQLPAHFTSPSSACRAAERNARGQFLRCRAGLRAA